MVAYDGERRIEIDCKRMVEFDKQPFAEHNEQQRPSAGRKDFPDVVEARIAQHAIIGLAEQE